MSEDALPSLLGGFRLEARLDVPAGGAEGVLCAIGDWNNGWACYLLDGRPVVAFSLLGASCRVAAPAPLAPGPRVLTVEYERARPRGGALRVAIDGVVVADGQLPDNLPFRWQIGGAGMLVGRDRGLPVSDDYEPPFACTARLDSVVLDGGASRPVETANVGAALRHE